MHVIGNNTLMKMNDLSLTSPWAAGGLSYTTYSKRTKNRNYVKAGEITLTDNYLKNPAFEVEV